MHTHLTAADILQLANRIETTLLHFTHCHSSYEPKYLAALRVLCHCYCLVMLELGEACCGLAPNAFHPPQEVDAIRAFSFRMAEMINTLGDKTRLLDHPWFYPHFINAIRHVLSSTTSYLNQDLDITQSLLAKIIPNQEQQTCQI